MSTKEIELSNEMRYTRMHKRVLELTRQLLETNVADEEFADIAIELAETIEKIEEAINDSLL